MNYNEMTVEELLLLNSIDITRFKKQISGEKLWKLRDDLDLYNTYRRSGFLVIGKHKICFNHIDKEMFIENYSNYLKKELYSLTDINREFDRIKAKRKELKGITFEILDADRIADVYDEDWCYFSGSLAGSCMRGNGDRYHTITSRLSNEEDMKIATLRNSEGILQARSLIWCNSFYDKVYANDNALSALMERKLEEAGFDYVGNGIVEIHLDRSLYDYDMPYMDNVCYYSESSLALSNCCYGEYEFQDISGEVWCSRCANCGSTAHRDDMFILPIYGDYICDCCYSDGVIAYAEDEEEYYYTEDLVYLEDKGHYVTENGGSFYYCIDRNCYYSEDYDLYYAEDTGEYYSEDTVLYYAEDTYEYFKDSDNLYFTVDTELYYKYNDDLYYYDGEYYDDKPEGYGE